MDLVGIVEYRRVINRYRYIPNYPIYQPLMRTDEHRLISNLDDSGSPICPSDVDLSSRKLKEKSPVSSIGTISEGTRCCFYVRGTRWLFVGVQRLIRIGSTEDHPKEEEIETRAGVIENITMRAEDRPVAYCELRV